MGQETKHHQQSASPVGSIWSFLLLLIMLLLLLIKLLLLLLYWPDNLFYGLPEKEFQVYNVERLSLGRRLLTCS